MIKTAAERMMKYRRNMTEEEKKITKKINTAQQRRCRDKKSKRSITKVKNLTGEHHNSHSDDNNTTTDLQPPPVNTPSRNPSQCCVYFPLYCAAGKPHMKERCLSTMENYYNVGDDRYGCPACCLVITGWIVFMDNHAQHAGEFKAGQKKALKQSKCLTFPSYCCASIHNNPTECRRLTMLYYAVADAWGCPHCHMLIDNETEFISNHAMHAGQWRTAQKLQLLPLTYYNIEGAYACPDCDIVMDNVDMFISEHLSHAGEFRRGQRNKLKRVFNIRRRMTESRNQSAWNLDELPSKEDHDATSSQEGINDLFETTGMQKGGASSSSSTLLVKRTVGSIYNKNAVSIEYKIEHIEKSIINFIQQNQNAIKRDLVTIQTKIQFMLECKFSKTVEGETEEKEWCFSNKAVPYHNTFLEDGANKLQEKISNYASGSSGWICEQILKVTFCCIKHSRVNRLSGRSYIPTPWKIYNKKCCVNVKNGQGDEKCFLYALLAVWKYSEIPHNHGRISWYDEYLPLLIYKNEQLPMKIKDVARFEKQNPQFSINIITYNEELDDMSTFDEGEEVYKNPAFDLIYRTNNTDASAVPINLLLIEKNSTFHYLGIINLSKLLNVYEHTPVRIQGIWCEHCIRCFRRTETYQKHLLLCKSNQIKNVLYTMPEQKELKFTDWSKTIPPAFIAYADFESLLEPCEIGQKHKPIAAAVLIMPGFEHTSAYDPEYKVFFGESCVIEFLTYLEEWGKKIKTWYKTYAHFPIDLTRMEETAFEEAKHCYLCGIKFNLQKSQIKVRDHDHFTGRYLGAACNKCNMSRRLKKSYLPIFFHNLKGYDMHHILKYGLSNFKDWSISCIPQTAEKFLALCCYIKDSVQLRFLDSYQFLNCSLSVLASLLPEEKKLFTNTLPFPDYVKKRKGVFPYSYITSVEKMSEALPEMQHFNDEIQTIDEEDYEHAQLSYRDCQCSSLKDYLLLYLKLDVYLLADIFQTFRETAREEDGLEPCRYFTIPGLSWDSALKSMGEMSLELLQDSTVYEFFEAGVRGGMTFVNKHFVDNTDGEILYIDINNLYGYALSQKLPCSNFEMIQDTKQLQDIVSSLPHENSDVGYYLEVDLHIPPHLHNKFKDLPPAPVKQCPPGSKTKKLMLTLEDKLNYKVHYSLLKFFIEMGVQVTKVHRACKFKQAYVFSEYIAHNTSRRASASNKFQKDFYKLKNNSLFGKTVENLRKRINIRIVNNERKLITTASRPNFQRLSLIDKDLAIATLGKETICLNRPVYIGQAILDISKLRMYRLNYEELEKYRTTFNCQIEIVAGDTDSFFLHCRNVSVRDQLLPQMLRDELLDSSNFSPEHSLYSEKFTNQIGKFKDETGCKFEIIEGVFLRPKCYSLKTDNDKAIKKAKGVTYKSVKEKLSHSNYLHLFYAYDPRGINDDDDDDEQVPLKKVCLDQTTIRSKQHQLFTVNTRKVALNCMDDKRQWLDNNTSLPYGHCDLALFNLDS